MCHDNFCKEQSCCREEQSCCCTWQSCSPFFTTAQKSEDYIISRKVSSEAKTLAHSRDDGLKEISSEIKDSFKNMLSGSMLANDPYVPFAWSIFRFVWRKL